jgi:hypothetical protein
MVGSPEKPGTIRFSLKATNGAGRATQTFRLTVATSPTSTTSTSTTSTSTTPTTTSSTTTSSTTTSSTTTSSTTTSPATTRCPALTDLSAAFETSGAPAFVLALCANADGELSAFLIGKNGALYRYDQAASGAWGTPQSMGGTWGTQPSVVANSSGRLSAFLISSENGELYRYDQAASGGWGTAQSMGEGVPSSSLYAPAVVANQTGQLSAFIINSNNGELVHYDQAASGAWGPPQPMFGTWSDELAPVVVVNPSGQLSAFLIGNNGALYRYDQDPSGVWGAPQDMGGTWP